MIDMHCHLREPGFEHKETIETGSKSAVKGGFTTICPMPNTKPTPDNPETVKYILDKAKEVNLCNILPFSSITKGEKGEELVNFKEMLEAGCVAFSDDGCPVSNAKTIRQAMLEINKLGSFTSEHCEEKSVSAGAINAGKVAEKLGVEGVLPEAEEIMASRDIVILKPFKLPLIGGDLILLLLKRPLAGLKVCEQIFERLVLFGQVCPCLFDNVPGQSELACDGKSVALARYADQKPVCRPECLKIKFTAGILHPGS